MFNRLNPLSYILVISQKAIDLLATRFFMGSHMRGLRTNWRILVPSNSHYRMTGMSTNKVKRRFAPLNQSRGSINESALPTLDGIVFDVDGTLCISVS
jgi:hypothetical protein